MGQQNTSTHRPRQNKTKEEQNKVLQSQP